ncbi:MAG: hypothetical protein AAGM67_02235 [Bacteroidota bacterium]
MNRLLCSLMILMICSACQNHETNVRQAATDYMQARLKHDFSRASLFVTPESQSHLEELSLMSHEYPRPSDLKLPFLCEQIDIQGDSAYAYYSLEPYLQQERLLLHRLDEQWLVVLNFKDVPDPMMLTQDLLLLEAEDTISALQKELDRIIFEEDSLLPDSSLLQTP